MTRRVAGDAGATPASRREPGGRWREWDGGNEGLERSVTSARLPSGAGVQSRLFPKTRSWFALGAPLELMSPLSIMRIVFALEALVWLTAGVAWRTTSLVWPLGAGLAVLGLWAVLLRARSLSERESGWLAALAVGTCALLLWADRQPGAAFAFVAVAVPVGVTAALFLRARVVVYVQLLSGLALLAGLAHRGGWGSAAGSSVLWVVGAGSAAAASSLLVRTVQRQGRLDADTGLPNGFGLTQLVRRRSDWSSFLVACISLGGIGDAREALGYRTGTELVRRAVEDIGQVMPSDALIGRVVADELVVICRLGGAGPVGPESDMPIAMAEDAQVTANKLERAIASGRYLADGVEVSLRASIGLAIAPWDGTDVEELVRRASLSAPVAASNGTSLARWSGGDGTLTGEDLALLADLRLAGERGELSLAYQPQISVSQRATVSVEALLRWASPGRGMVPPDRFIVLAERTGLIDRITEWVFAEALDAQARWRAAGLDVPVSVNLSGKSLTRPNLPSWAMHELSVRGLPPRSLSLEITETAAPEDLARAVELLRPLYEQGVRISIDDFGVGYTSLSVLPRLPVNELKVDRSFVLNSTSSPVDAAIVRTICDLGHRLGLDVVAEGVENEEISRFVTEAGCDLLQGYHFARPMKEADLLVFLDSSSHNRGGRRRAIRS